MFVKEDLPTTRAELSGRLALMNSEGLVAQCMATHDMKRAFDVFWMGMTVHAARRERTIPNAFEIAETKASRFGRSRWANVEQEARRCASPLPPVDL